MLITELLNVEFNDPPKTESELDDMFDMTQSSCDTYSGFPPVQCALRYGRHCFSSRQIRQRV